MQCTSQPFRSIRLALIAMFVCATMFAQSNPSPLLNVPLVPESAVPGGSGFTLTVNGTGFVSGATVQWNGSPRSTTFISGSQLKAAINAADIATARTAIVTVRNPGARGSSSDVVYFPVRESSTTVSFAPHGGVLYKGPLATGDFNGDGKMDIAVVTDGHNDNRLYVEMYPGKGDGTFGKPIQSAARFNGYLCCILESLLAADFSGEGKLDLAITEFDGDGNDAFDGYGMLGNGDGTFRETPGRGYYTGGAMAVGDVNGDGLGDIVTGGYADEAEDTFTNVYLTGESSKLTKSQTFGDIGGFSAALGDFNGDGKLDLALVGPVWYGQTNGVWVALGNGDGTFQTPVEYPTTYPASNVFAADLNGDGKLDLVTDGICVLYGKGDGTFTAGPCLSSGVINPPTMALADFNGDGNLDVLLWEPSSSVVDVYLGQGDGTFQNPIGYPTPECQSPCFLAVGDFNGDGKPDFALELPQGTGVFLQK